MRILRVAIAAMVAAAVLTAGAADAAAPRIVIFSGKPLAQPIVISAWKAIFRVFEELVPARARVAPRADLAGRPRLKVSMFWGPRWIDYLREGKRSSTLRPRQADQFGSFYPAWRGRDALIDVSGSGQSRRVVPPRALAVLRQFRVPTQLRR